MKLENPHVSQPRRGGRISIQSKVDRRRCDAAIGAAVARSEIADRQIVDIEGEPGGKVDIENMGTDSIRDVPFRGAWIARARTAGPTSPAKN